MGREPVVGNGRGLGERELRLGDASARTGRGVLMRAAALFGGFGVLMGVVLTVLVTNGLREWDSEAFVFVSGLVGLVAVILACDLLSWYVRFGDIEIRIDDETVRVLRRGRELFSARRDRVLKVVVRGSASWSSLNPSQGFADGRFPYVRIWTRDEEWSSPGLLLWQGEAFELHRWIHRRLGKPWS